MKKLLTALALASAACAAPAFAAVGVSIQVGEPGFYGRLDIGGYERPRIINNRPVLLVQRYRNVAPVYLRVPPGHQRNWSRFCGRYDACYRPVYFVRDEWYRDVYAPRYRREHARDHHHGRHDHGRHERRDDRRDGHRDDHRGDRNDRNDRDDRHDRGADRGGDRGAGRGR